MDLKEELPAKATLNRHQLSSQSTDHVQEDSAIEEHQELYPHHLWLQLTHLPKKPQLLKAERLKRLDGFSAEADPASKEMESKM
jgi:hypothetical protein